VALLSFGEGWHNNHHAHPTSARHGLAWYEIDFNWYGIWTLQKLGLATDVYRTKLPEKMADLEAVPDQEMAAAATEPERDLVSA
jgi:stearoyl-CoA desaturase (delta-9 desaturase)